MQGTLFFNWNLNYFKMKLKKLSQTVLLILIGIILLPVALILIPIIWFKDQKFDKEFNDYLKSIDGKIFFCFNNRRKGFDYIKTEIIPKIHQISDQLKHKTELKSLILKNPFIKSI